MSCNWKDCFTCPYPDCIKGKKSKDVSDIHKSYYQRHKEERLAYQKQYNDTHKEQRAIKRKEQWANMTKEQREKERERWNKNYNKRKEKEKVLCCTI